jgi:hypothetical protein
MIARDISTAAFPEYLKRDPRRLAFRARAADRLFDLNHRLFRIDAGGRELPEPEPKAAQHGIHVDAFFFPLPDQRGGFLEAETERPHRRAKLHHRIRQLRKADAGLLRHPIQIIKRRRLIRRRDRPIAEQARTRLNQAGHLLARDAPEVEQLRRERLERRAGEARARRQVRDRRGHVAHRIRHARKNLFETITQRRERLARGTRRRANLIPRGIKLHPDRRQPGRHRQERRRHRHRQFAADVGRLAPHRLPFTAKYLRAVGRFLHAVFEFGLIKRQQRAQNADNRVISHPNQLSCCGPDRGALEARTRPPYISLKSASAERISAGPCGAPREARIRRRHEARLGTRRRFFVSASSATTNQARVRSRSSASSRRCRAAVKARSSSRGVQSQNSGPVKPMRRA